MAPLFAGANRNLLDVKRNVKRELTWIGLAVVLAVLVGVVVVFVVPWFASAPQ